MDSNPTPWTTCRIGSCQQHQDCMYAPCLGGDVPWLQAEVERLKWLLFHYADMTGVSAEELRRVHNV